MFFNNLSQNIRLLGYTTLLERFIFHSLRSMLIIYCINSLDYTDSFSYHLFACFMALSYTTPILGGYIADKAFGYSKCLIIGSSCLLAGTLCLLLLTTNIIPALTLLIIGTGFFKSNITSLFSLVDDYPKDKIFSYYFMMINVGALGSPILCTMIGEIYGWKYCFIILVIASLACLLCCIKIHISFKDQYVNKTNHNYGVFITVITVLATYIIISKELYINYLMLFSLLAILICTFIYNYRNFQHKQTIALLASLFVFNTIFWSLFEQIGSTINIFTHEYVDRKVSLRLLDIDLLNTLEIPTTFFQSINSIFVILLTPCLGVMWNYLAKKRIDLSDYTKFSFGLIIVGISYALFFFIFDNDHTNLVEVYWLLLFYLILTLGELFVAPIGLSLIARLAPSNIRSLTMGLWQFSTAFSNWVIGVLAINLTTGDQSHNNILGFHSLFGNMALLGVVSGVLMIFIFKALTTHVYYKEA